MTRRMEREFPYVDLQVLPPIDPSDPTFELRRRARLARAEAQREMLISLAGSLVALVRIAAERLRPAGRGAHAEELRRLPVAEPCREGCGH